MSKPNEPKKASRRFPFFCLLYLGLTIAIMLHLLYLYAGQDLTIPKAQYLHRIFKKQPYLKIATKAQQTQYGIVQTDCKQCANQLIQFIGYQSSKPIFIRDYQQLEGVDKIARPLLWYITMMIRHYIVQPQPKPKIWALYSGQNQLTTEIQRIKNLEPRSSIFVVVPLKKNIKYKGFKKLGKLQNFDPHQVLKSVKIPQQLARVYSSYHNHSIYNIFNSISRKSKTIQQHLGKYYVPLQNLSKRGEKILTDLCRNGRLKQNTEISQNLMKKLSKYGLKIIRGTAYWKDDRYRLNLMFQKNLNCVKIEPPFQLIQAEQIQKQQTKSSDAKTTQTQNKCECKLNIPENQKIKVVSNNQVSKTSIHVQKQDNQPGDQQDDDKLKINKMQNEQLDKQQINANINDEEDEDQQEEQVQQTQNIETQEDKVQQVKQLQEQQQQQQQQQQQESIKQEKAQVQQTKQQGQEKEQQEQKVINEQIISRQVKNDQEQQKNEEKTLQIDEIIKKVEKIQQQQL